MNFEDTVVLYCSNKLQNEDYNGWQVCSHSGGS